MTIVYDNNGFFTLNSGLSTYIGYKPNTYNPNTPISLFVWMHGCGGNAAGDMWNIAPYETRSSQSYIAISIGGRDGACWDVNTDSAKVLAAITDVSKYFNINPNKIYLGGYSSGGDLTYRTAFYNADKIAGVLVENSTPFRDTGSTQTNSINAAKWKFNIAHLAHTSDTTYPITVVTNEINALKNAGFPVTFIQKPGTHWDNDTNSSGTNYDLIHSLLPYLNSGWQLSGAPAPVASPTVPTSVSTGSTNITGISTTSTTNKAPTDQSFSVNKIIPAGLSIPAGTYTFKAITRTVWSDQDSVCVNIILNNNYTNVDFTWKSITVDLRGHVLQDYWNSTILSKSGATITFGPSAGSDIVVAGNKNNFGFCFQRMVDPTKAYYQVLVKSIDW